LEPFWIRAVLSLIDNYILFGIFLIQ